MVVATVLDRLESRIVEPLLERVERHLRDSEVSNLRREVQQLREAVETMWRGSEAESPRARMEQLIQELMVRLDAVTERVAGESSRAR